MEKQEKQAPPKPLKKFVPKKADPKARIATETNVETYKKPEGVEVLSLPFQGPATVATAPAVAKATVPVTVFATVKAPATVATVPGIATVPVPAVAKAKAKPAKAKAVTIADRQVRQDRVNYLFETAEDGSPYDGYEEQFREKVEDTPLLKQYEEGQKAAEESGHYEMDVQTYMPSTRKALYKFINKTYAERFNLPTDVLDKKLDPEACQKLMAGGTSRVEPFLYQRFIKEYIRQSSPYRGILVYHGLGSGKTCSSIAAAEALYGVANKKIIVMTPKSLRGNFINEISFCGFRHFSLQNFWVSIPLLKTTPAGAQVPLLINEIYGRSVLSLSEQYIDRLKRVNGELWIPDFNKSPAESNFSSLSVEQQDAIRNQINETINNRIEFISYNGVTAKTMKGWACNDPTHFDNAVIVIDEIHNLIRLMQSSIVPYLMARPGKQRKIKIEPVEPGTWIPNLCKEPNKNYKRGYLFYRLLVGAKNSKIIGLSGTPLINFPEELGILANVLAGYIDSVEFVIDSADPKVAAALKEIAEKDPRVDFIRIDKGDSFHKVLLTVFNEGYIKILDPATNQFKGVSQSNEPAAQDGINAVFARIKEAAAAKGIPITKVPTFSSMERLPPDDDTFRDTFVDLRDMGVRKENEFVLKKRLAGLISYYKGAKRDYFPDVRKDELIECDLSEYAGLKYYEARLEEIEKETAKKSADKQEDIFAAVELFAKAKNPSSYRFRSRALCNFAFPESIERPFPNEGILEDEEVSAISEDTPIEGDADYNRIAEEANVPVLAREEAEEGIIREEIQREEAQVEKEEQAEDEKLQLQLQQQQAPKGIIASAIATVVGAATGATAAVVGATATTAVATAKELITYKQQVENAMSKLNVLRGQFMVLNAPKPEESLGTYSRKLYEILTRMKDSPGPVLVYSQFKVVEGLGVLGIALKANGYDEIRFTGKWIGDEPEFSPESMESIRKGPSAGVKRFITFSGEGTPAQRATALNIFNGFWNKLPKGVKTLFQTSGFDLDKKYLHGEICACIGITSAGAEGISLRNVRQVHIMEPYWNMVRIEQVKGRAVRICSHMDLPVEERNVDIYTYVTRFSEKQLTDKPSDGGIPAEIMTKDSQTLPSVNGSPPKVVTYTSDQNILLVSQRKEQINKNLLDVLKESAVDCMMNQPDNELLECFVPEEGKNPYMFDPDLRRDIVTTSSEYRATAVAAATVAATGSLAAAGQTEERTRAVTTVLALKISLKDRSGTVQEYILGQPDVVKQVVEFYLPSDKSFSTPIGSLQIIPTGYRGVKFYKPAARKEEEEEA